MTTIFQLPEIWENVKRNVLKHSRRFSVPDVKALSTPIRHLLSTTTPPLILILNGQRCVIQVIIIIDNFKHSKFTYGDIYWLGPKQWLGPTFE